MLLDNEYSDSLTMPVYSLRNERRDMYAQAGERLPELPFHLKDFDDMDNTPTTAVTSLPTPRQEVAALVSDAAQIDERMPSAPQIRDLDSFGEATTKGDFDFEFEDDAAVAIRQPIATLNVLALEGLPVAEDVNPRIMGWLAEVEGINDRDSSDNSESTKVDANTPTESITTSTLSAKRPRSLNLEEDMQRRTRQRARSSPCSSVCLELPAFMFTTAAHSLPPRPRSCPPRPSPD